MIESVRSVVAGAIVVALTGGAASAETTPSFDVAVGAGRIFNDGTGLSPDSQNGYQLSGGVGARFSSRIDVGGRIAAFRAHFPAEHYSDVGRAAFDLTLVFVGPIVRVNAYDWLWFGAGVGCIYAHQVTEPDEYPTASSSFGFGSDIRAGVNFARSGEHSFELSIGAKTGFSLRSPLDSPRMYQAGLLLGYRYN